MDRWSINEPTSIGGDDRFHLLAVLEGEIRVIGDPIATPVVRGGTLLLPASIGACAIEPLGPSTLLDIYLP